MSVITALIGSFWPQIAAIGAAIAVAIGFWLKAKASGRKEAEAKQAVRDLKSEKDVSDAKDRMASEVARGPDPERTDERLRSGDF